MVKRFFFYVLLFYTIGVNVLNAQSISQIAGNQLIGMTDTLRFSVPLNASVKQYQWLPPLGCKVLEGQGSAAIRLRSTFLAQDGNLRLVRRYEDTHSDTLSLPLTVYRAINKVADHTINSGESLTIGDKVVSEADIYYEQTGEQEGKPLYTAHRVTVIPSYQEMTKPYLQVVTDSSVWICWKTSSAASSTIAYGSESTSLTSKEVGTEEALSDSYYWHSVQLKGLTANTFYSYQVLSGDNKSEVYRFRTAPKQGSSTPFRILLMGDHQIKSRSGYEWLMQAAKRKIEEKYGNVEDNISMIMNVGDQVDLGSLEQYELIHLNKSALLSPYLSIMTAVGNHETYGDTNMATYAAHYHYEDLAYKGIKSGTENYYAYQIGRVLFVVLSTEHTGDVQKAWVRRVVDAVKQDASVDFMISVNHRPIQAEQYIGDYSKWVREEIIPILSETPKHVLNFGGHHHLYHRGQLTDYPLYHIINGAASWDQLWGMSSEEDYADVQKTIDYWGYQILEFNFDKQEMKADCYAIGNRDLVVDNLLIDSFSRRLGVAAPEKPKLAAVDPIVHLPYTFEGGRYATTSGDSLNTTQYQISNLADFSSLTLNKVRDVEDFYGSTGSPLHIPIDKNESVDITKLTIDSYGLANGTYYVRLRYRNNNLDWSNWSDTLSFTVEGSTNGDPKIVMDAKTVQPQQEFTVSYSNVVEGKDAWIGIYHKFEEPSNTTASTKWAYTTGSNGKVTFSLDKSDEYYAVLFKDGGYTEACARIPFFVGSTVEYSTDKTIYKVGEPVTISYSNAPALSDDWLGIYRMGETPGVGGATSDSWLYLTEGQNKGTMTLSTGIGSAYQLSKGYYYVGYFTRGYYFEPFQRHYFSVGTGISSVWADTQSFAPNEDVLIHYSDGPGTPKDWVGFYKEGKTVGTDELDGFYYTYSATSGTIVVPAGSLKPADYFVSLYINDSYDEVSDRIHVSIGKAPSLTVQAKTDAPQVLLTYDSNKSWCDSITSISLDGLAINSSNYRTMQDRIELTIPELSNGMHSLSIEATGWQKNQVNFNSTLTGIKDVSSLKDVTWTIADQKLTIYNEEGNYRKIRLSSPTGVVLKEYPLAKGENSLDISSLQSGTLLLTLESASITHSQLIFK